MSADSTKKNLCHAYVYGYDNLNRETLKDIPGGTAADVFSAYDLAGRRLSARFASAAGQGVIYAYDSAGRRVSETNTIGISRALSYQYDIASNRTRITWPDGFFAQYSYDALNRVDQIAENGVFSGATLLADYAYDALSRRASVTRGNGAVSTFAYDTASRLTALTQNLPATANDQTYGFAYTPASQLSSRSASNDNYNWLGQTIASRSYARNGLNQYTNVGGVAFAYASGDGQRGNLTFDGLRSFDYDLENRLIGVSGSASLALSYDPLGRLQQTVGTATTQFLYDGDRLVAEYDGAGLLLHRYVHGPGVDEPLVWYEGAGLTDRRYLITDHQGSIIAENGAATVRYAYGPYGEPASWTGSRFRYTGQIALPEVSLYHYKARVYDPRDGRFLQTDPVGYEGGDFNLYAYVANDPLNNADPSGAVCYTCMGRAVALAGGRAGRSAVVAIVDGPEPGPADVVAVGGLILTTGALLWDLGNAVLSEEVEQPDAQPDAGEGENTNPYNGPVDRPVIVVDNAGNAIPVGEGEQVTSSPDGDYQQVRDSEGRATGVRSDRGGHRGQSDPSAQGPHAHRPGVTQEDGNPHLPIRPRPEDR